MSAVQLQGNASGTGTFTISSPNSNSNRTLTLPDAAGNVVIDSATQSFTNKSFDSAPVSTVSGTAPISFCRAWVNFNGTGTVAIRASGNVSSITDNGTGDYTINFATSMLDANYTVCSTGTDGGNYITSLRDSTTAPTASSVRVATRASNGALNDTSYALFAIFR